MIIFPSIYNVTFENIVVLFCFFYTVVSFIEAIYLYIKNHQRQQKDSTFQYNSPDDDYNYETDDDRPKFRVLTPELFGNTVNNIFQAANRISDKDDFSNGRRSAYFEVFNIIKKDCAAYDVGYKRWNPNMFGHIITRIIDNAENAADKAYYDCGSFSKGRESAYLEIIHTIVSDFLQYEVNLEEYGLQRFC